MAIDLIAKLSYFYTTPSKQWSEEDARLYYEITQLISKNGKYVQDDSSMNSWQQHGGHMRKIAQYSPLEKSVIQYSELNRFKFINNPDPLAGDTNESRFMCLRTREEKSGIIGVYYIGSSKLEKLFDEFYSKTK